MTDLPAGLTAASDQAWASVRNHLTATLHMLVEERQSLNNPPSIRVFPTVAVSLVETYSPLQLSFVLSYVLTKLTDPDTPNAVLQHFTGPEAEWVE